MTARPPNRTTQTCSFASPYRDPQGVVCALVVAAFLLGGCKGAGARQTEQSAALHSPVTGAELTAAQQRDAIEAMRSVIPTDFEPIRLPMPTGAARWSDLPAAVAVAVAEHEIVVLRKRVTHTTAVFDLWSVDDRPGRIEAALQDDRTIVLDATFGRFQNDTKTAAAILASLDRAMRRAAALPSLADLPQ